MMQAKGRGRRWRMSLLLVTLLSCGAWATISCTKVSPASGGPLGTAALVAGDAHITRAGKDVALTKAETPLLEGDVVATGDAGEAVARVGLQVHMVGPKSELRLDNGPGKGDAGMRAVTLLKGMATFFLPKGTGNTYKFQASCDTVVAAVKGTVFRLEKQDDGVHVQVARGQVDLYNGPADIVGGAEKSTPVKALTEHGQAVVLAGQVKDLPPMSEHDLAWFKQQEFFNGLGPFKIDLGQY